MNATLDYEQAKAALEWQVELGVTDAIGETPINRYEVVVEAKPKATPAAAKQAAPVVEKPVAVDAVAIARGAAAACDSLDALKVAMADFAHCELKKGARSLVFADGSPEAKVMVVGEGPGREEDREGRPFVGSAGQLLDKMFAAIGLARKDSLYITNVVPWRPPQNRDPSPEEIAMMLPFLERHIALVKPEVLVLVGNISCEALLGMKGITRLRGEWTAACDIPAMPMFHPAYLLRSPDKKRETWADLLAVRAKLESTS